MKRIIALSIAVLFAVTLLTACGQTINLDQTELSMTAGDSVKLSAGNATKVTWTSSDDAVVTVTAGLVSAKSAGTAVITAALENGATATCTVNVADKLINVLTLDVKSARVDVGKTIQLTVSYAPADATDRRISWSSSDDTVATVDDKGYVTGVTDGIASITCKTPNDVEATCTITVGTAELPTIAATQPPAAETPSETVAPTEAEKPTETQTPTESGKSDPAPDDGDSNFIFADSSTRYLTPDEVSAKLKAMTGNPISDSFAQDAVNEIYARNGYIFRTPSISAYYQSKSWYRPDMSYDGSLTPIEQANIALLSGY